MLDKNVAKWPSKLSYFQMTKYIRDNLPADEQWENFHVKKICSSSSFKNAHIKAQEAQQTSNVETSATEDDGTNNKRKRKVPARFKNDSSTDDDLENCLNYNKSPVKKRFAIPTLPSFNVTPQVPTIAQSSQMFSESILVESDIGVAFNEVPTAPVVINEALPISSGIPETSSAIPELNNLFLEASVDTTPGIISGVEPNVASLFGMMKHMYHEMERMRRQMKKMTNEHAQLNATLVALQTDSGKVTRNSSATNPVLPDLKLPIQTDNDLINLNRKLLEDLNLSSVLVSYLSNICYGKSLSYFTTNLLRKFFLKDVALLYSRLGRKGKKPLENLKEVFNVLLATMSLRFPEEKRDDLAERLGKVLSCAKEWGVLNKKKSSLVELNLIDNSLDLTNDV